MISHGSQSTSPAGEVHFGTEQLTPWCWWERGVVRCISLILVPLGPGGVRCQNRSITLEPIFFFVGETEEEEEVSNRVDHCATCQCAHMDMALASGSNRRELLVKG